jgi:predicted anti-sigma-YlaC factor YlaD
MRCFDVQVELEAYVDGELSPERRALLEGHLAGCEGCRAELARLEAVVAALETWPLVAEPAQFTEGVMARVRSPSALPGFRIQWSDLAISLAGASLVFAAALLWRYLTLAGLAYLYRIQMYLRLEMLRLRVLLLTQCPARTSTATWGLVLVGVALVTALSLAVWDRTGAMSVHWQVKREA